MRDQKSEDLARELTAEIWQLIPPSVRRANRLTWIVVYNVVRKAIKAVGCVDMEKFSDYFDVKAIDVHSVDAMYMTLITELSKYACVDGEKMTYDYDANVVRGMTINYILNAINECLKSPCTEDDVQELINLVNDNRAVLGMEYYRLISKVEKLKPMTKVINEVSTKPAKALVEDTEENWHLILRPVRRGVDSGSRVSDVRQEDWVRILKPIRKRRTSLMNAVIQSIEVILRWLGLWI